MATSIPTKMSDIVEKFNRLTGKNVKRFATKNAAVVALVKAEAEAEKAKANAGKKVLKSPNQSAAQKKAWADPKVKAKRSERTEVVVRGYGTYSSVPQAFRELGLDMKKFQHFRAELKAAGKLAYEENGERYHFKANTRYAA